MRKEDQQINKTDNNIGAGKKFSIWLFILSVIGIGPVRANPVGEQVQAGSATFDRSQAGILNVNQSTVKAIINWQDFSIQKNETTNINQPTAGSLSLNRVVGNNLSAIYGTLRSNGSVILVNPHGVTFGAGGQVDVRGSFTAATRDLTNDNFLKGGDLTFSGNSNGDIVNQGLISGGKDVYLIANKVDNQGSVVAGDGVGLAAGDRVVLKERDDGDGRVSVQIGGNGAVQNSGAVQGALAELRAAGGDPHTLAVNTTGLVRATRVTNEGGKIILSAGATGGLNVGGSVDASSSSAKGGSVVLEGGSVNVDASAKITASGASGGGSVKIGGGFQGKDASVANSSATTVAAGATIAADSEQSGDAGQVVLWSDGTTDFNGAISAAAHGSSGNGGQVEVSGADVLIFRGKVDTRAANGKGGNLLLDPADIAITAGGVTGANSISDADLATLLGTSAVTLSTSSPNTSGQAAFDAAVHDATGSGDITVNDGVNVTWVSGNALTLTADRNINIIAGVTGITIDGSGAASGAIVTLKANRGTGVDGGIHISAESTGDVAILTSANGAAGTGKLNMEVGGTTNSGAMNAALSVVATTAKITLGDASRMAVAVGDVSINSASLGWIGAKSMDIHAANDVNILNAVWLQNTSEAIALYPIVAQNSFNILAGGNVNVGEAENRTDHVHVGSEFNNTLIVAGDSNFDGVVDVADKDVTISGGKNADTSSMAGYSTQVGYRVQDNQRGISSDEDGDTPAKNGNITVRASGNVTLSGAIDGVDGFAQIGHGGAAALASLIQSGYDIVDSNITVAADADGNHQGDVTVAGGSHELAFAQIGHGSYIPALGGDAPIATGNISGDITVTGENITVGRDVTGVLNIANNMVDDASISQIGSGSHVALIAAFTEAGEDISIGKIAGNITVIAQDALKVGADVTTTATGIMTSPAVIARIGHGSAIDATLGISTEDFDINIGQIASFQDANLVVHGSAVTVSAANVSIGGTVATGLSAVNNLVYNAAVGHGSVIRANASGATGLATNVTEGAIAGDVTVTDTKADGKGITVSAKTEAGLGAIDSALMASRIGHGNVEIIGGSSSSDVENAGGITLRTSDILGAAVLVRGVERDGAAFVAGDDVVLDAIATAGLAPVANSAQIANIGHGGASWVFSRSGSEGADGAPSTDGGNVAVVKGSIWDGYQGSGVNSIGGSVDVTVNAPWAIKATANNVAGLAVAAGNILAANIGNGSDIVASAGAGGDGAAGSSTQGGAGGSVTVEQATAVRSGNPDGTGSWATANGIRGAVVVTAINEGLADGAVAIGMNAISTAALVASKNSVIRSQIGNGDVIDVVAGSGGDGGDGNALGTTSAGGGQGGDATIGSYDVQSDINVTAYREIQINGTATNAVAFSDLNQIAAQIGHGSTLTARSGAGGAGGTADTADSLRGGDGGAVNLTGPATVADTVDGTTSNISVASTSGGITVHATDAPQISEGKDTVYATIGHRSLLTGEGGSGGDGGTSGRIDPQDGGDLGHNLIIDASGGNGGAVNVTAGNLQGNITLSTNINQNSNGILSVLSDGGNGTNTLVVANVGNGSSVVGISQKGGDAGNLSDSSLGLADAAMAGDIILTNYDKDGNRTSALQGVEVVSATVAADGKADSLQDVITGFGSVVDGESVAAATAANKVMRIDVDGDAEFVDVAGTWTANPLFLATNPMSLVANNRVAGVDLNRDGKVDVIPTATGATGEADLQSRLIAIVDVDGNKQYDQLAGRTSSNVDDYWMLTGKAATDANLDKLDPNKLTIKDFSKANGGNGGDVLVKDGFVVGDITVNTYKPTSGTDSILVHATAQDGVAATGGPGDKVVASIGHFVYAHADANGISAGSSDRAGWAAVSPAPAVGGNAGMNAINGNGGVGGSAAVELGGLFGAGTVSETFHMAGAVTINQTSANLSSGIDIAAKTDLAATDNLVIAKLGHEAMAYANSAAGGNANPATDADSSADNTESAHGGAAGAASISQANVKGVLTVKAGSNDSEDVSLKITAEQTAADTVGDDSNTVIAEIGHGSHFVAAAADGGNGGKGQADAEGGAGGASTIVTGNIVDAPITIDTATTLGNGVTVSSKLGGMGGNHLLHAIIGHSNVAKATGGAGGDAANNNYGTEQYGQIGAGGDGGAVAITQGWINNAIAMDIGPNTTGDVALTIEALADSDKNVANNQVVAAIGSSDFAYGESKAGGKSIQGPAAPSGITDDTSSSPKYRAGGDGGSVTITQTGIGQVLANREVATIYQGVNAGSAGAIDIRLHDQGDGDGGYTPSGDGVLIHSTAGLGDNADQYAIQLATIGHLMMAKADASAATGGDANQQSGTGNYSNIATDPAGAGGSATSTQGVINGNVSVNNVLDGQDNTGVAGTTAGKITILAETNEPTDTNKAEARIGHVRTNEVLGGAGGNGSLVAAGPPANKGSDYFLINERVFDQATQSYTNDDAYASRTAMQGGTGGMVTATQAAIYGHIALTAEQSIEVTSLGGTVSSGAALAGLGHRLEQNAIAGNGGNTGNYNTVVVQPTTGSDPTLVMDTAAALAAQAGAGGDVLSTQGALLGNISMDARVTDTSVVDAGILITSTDGEADASRIVSHVGHNTELFNAIAGNGGDIPAYENGAGGDGGAVTITQAGQGGSLNLTSTNKVTITSAEGGASGTLVRTIVGHTSNVGVDEMDNQYGVTSGKGGSELATESNGYNGNGGAIQITQAAGNLSNDMATTGVGATAVTVNDITISGTADSADGISVKIAAAVNNGSTVETLIGHGLAAVNVVAGAAGQMHADHAPKVLLETNDSRFGGEFLTLISHQEGLTQGRGGAVTLTQLAINSNITVTGYDKVDVGATTSLGGSATVVLGHRDVVDVTSGNGGDSIALVPNNEQGGTGDGGKIILNTAAMTANILVSSTTEDVLVASVTGTAGEATIAMGQQLAVKALSGDGGTHRGITPSSAGEGGDIEAALGALGGNVTLSALAADKKVAVSSTTGSGGTALVLLGHTAAVELTAGRSGYGDGGHLATADAAATSAYEPATDIDGDHVTDAATAQTEIAKAIVDLDAANTALAAANRVIAALEQMQVNKDRLTTADQADLTAQITAAKAARDALADKVGQIAAAITVAKEAINSVSTPSLGLDGAVGVAGSTNENVTAVADKMTVVSELFAAMQPNIDALTVAVQAGLDTSADGNIPTTWVKQFADHADAGKITQTLAITGNVALSANNTTGTVSTTSVTSSSGTAQTELGHRLSVANTTGIGGGQTTGAPDDGGIAGDGGAINATNTVGGNATVQANTVVAKSSTSSGGAADLHYLHDVSVINSAAKSDLEGLLGHGGDVDTTLTVTGNASITANALSDAIGSSNGKIGAVAGSAGTAELTIGHQVEALNTSLSDNGVAGTGTDPATRGGTLDSTQTVSGNITINLGLDGTVSDINVLANDGGGVAVTNIGHVATQSAISGTTQDDGDAVTATQTLTGSINFVNIEDVKISTTNTASSTIAIGHEATQTAVSGHVGDTVNGNDYGGAVTATQTIGSSDAVATINFTGAASGAVRSFVIAASGAAASDIQVGHGMTQTAKSAADWISPTAEPSNNAVDVSATQSLTGGFDIKAGQIEIGAADAAASTVQLGHDVAQTVDTDMSGTSIGHISASTTLASSTALTTVAAVVGTDGTLNPTLAGDVELTSAAAAHKVLIGNTSTLTVGHQESGGQVPNGSVVSDQIVTGAFTVTTLNDLTMTVDGNGGTVQLGNQTAQTNNISPDSPAPGAPMETTWVDADGVTQASAVTQSVTSNITLDVGNNLVAQTASGLVEVGHTSPAGANFAQKEIGKQTTTGNITVTVGTNAAAAAPNGAAAAGGDDALLDASAGGAVQFGHTIDTSLANQTQVAIGDITVKAMGDLEVNKATIGHQGYNFADDGVVTGVASGNAAYVRSNTVTTTLVDEVPTAALTQGAYSTVRNRIQGNTTIGAGQNTPAHNSNMTADAMKFVDATINSGYGEVGRAGDGELRFYTASRSNVSIDAPSKFNDSASNADAIVRTGGEAELTNGTLHEEPFALMRTGGYTDAVASLGNFAFYFQQVVTNPVFYSRLETEGFAIDRNQCGYSLVDKMGNGEHPNCFRVNIMSDDKGKGWMNEGGSTPRLTNANSWEMSDVRLYRDWKDSDYAKQDSK